MSDQHGWLTHLRSLVGGMLIFDFDNSPNARNINSGSLFYQRNKHSNLMRASSSQDSCSVKDSDKIKHCIQHSYLNSLHTTMPLTFLRVLMAFYKDFRTELKLSIPHGVAASASAAIAKAVKVLTFCCSSTNPASGICKTQLQMATQCVLFSKNHRHPQCYELHPSIQNTACFRSITLSPTTTMPPCHHTTVLSEL